MGDWSDAGQLAASGPRSRHPEEVDLRGTASAGRRQDRLGRSAWVAVGRFDAGLCRSPEISMVQATDFGKLHDRTQFRGFDGSLSGASLSSER